MAPRAADGFSVLAGAVHALALSPWASGLHAMLPALMQTLALWALLRLLLRAEAPRQGARRAWLYGTAWLIGATGWIYVSLHHFGGMPAPIAGAAVLLLSAALSGYLAAVGWAWVRWRSGVWWRDAGMFAGLWLLAELARALIFTGFPWGASGYGLIDSPLDRLAPWLGVYGLGAVWAWCVACLACGGRRWTAPVPLLAWVLALAWLPSARFTQMHGQPLRVALLQGNVPQDEKFANERIVGMLLWHAAQLKAADADLVMAPETAIPLLPAQLPEGYWDALVAMFGEGSGRAALIGVPLGSFEQGYSNSVVGLKAGQADPYRYDKHHLVPFGEFIPAGFHWFVALMNMPLGDFSRGPLDAPSFTVRGQRIAPNICYEDLFGEELASRFTDKARSPTVLANVSNLAWFGDTVAIAQHVQIARMRSLEFQVPSIRATNTGATVVIDAFGRVTDRMPTQTRGVLNTQVQGFAGQTPFAWWAGRFGVWPLVALGLLLAVAGAGRHRLSASAPPTPVG
ncbi:apolipoprotein N-acyltransferase [Aquabacterium commune]|uniref:Apolipoprotein N-acyltransferase n=1 Tax=Aquabacterium commune TaxID=70586 RepID=A0A4R6REZ9_9BURK|nr:apolipoprotein N-acyltransferase [Aquabacterium commune]TDP84655.1 apolipoprotein N-acyltransferase [Aquabacterium commune]